MSNATAKPSSPARETRAEGVLYSFLAAIGIGDTRAAAACFTRAGCLVTPDGTAVHGRAEIAAILAQMVARRTKVEVEQLAVRRADDIALATGTMVMHFDGPDGTRIAQTCGPTLTLHRVEGTWKIAILAPWARWPASQKRPPNKAQP